MQCQRKQLLKPEIFSANALQELSNLVLSNNCPRLALSLQEHCSFLPLSAVTWTWSWCNQVRSKRVFSGYLFWERGEGSPLHNLKAFLSEWRPQGQKLSSREISWCGLIVTENLHADDYEKWNYLVETKEWNKSSWDLGSK